MTRIQESAKGTYYSPEALKQINKSFHSQFDLTDAKAMRQLGFGMDQALAEGWSNLDYSYQKAKRLATFASDSLQPTITTASVGTPIQFLQNWLPGFIYTVTQIRAIDDFVGLFITGSWEDSQVVFGDLERTGYAFPYQDLSNVPFASWNPNFNIRTVTRWEEGLRVGNLEAAMSARMLIDTSMSKRQSCALQLEITRNQIGFVGYNTNNATYGFLNDPNLPAYLEVAEGVSTETTWASKTYLEIIQDIITAAVTLQNNSGGIIDPYTTPMTLAVATAAVGYLAKTTDFPGVSVKKFLEDTYPLMKIKNAPQLNDANSGQNVFYLYADRITDESTDGGQTWVQAVQTRFQTLGILQANKYYEEDYVMATAGLILKRPWAVIRYFGI